MRCRLTVENKGRAPIRDVRFTFDPPMPCNTSAEIPFFSPGNLIELEFHGRDQSYSDDPVTALRWSHPEWSFNWTARNLGARRSRTSVELGVEFELKRAKRQSTRHHQRSHCGEARTLQVVP